MLPTTHYAKSGEVQVAYQVFGEGLSDQVAHLPAMDERMDDVRAVMDAVGIERATQFGISEGGSLTACAGEATTS
jgi:pimeloyl-ACP methyl ester carboxylesterase